MSDTIEGKTPWEFACDWYKPSEIARSIARTKLPYIATLSDYQKVPTDVYSEEFANWLTDQYRLAMTKGIQLGQSATRKDSP